MKLIQVTDRIWYFPLDDTKDRPILGYIRGDRFCVAVDAGHSAEHVQEFYAAIKAAGLPLPALTVITHWHWDHTFGMHAVNGLTLANRRTNEHLTALLAEHGDDLLGFITPLDPFTGIEYANGQEVKVVLSDLEYKKRHKIRAGGVDIEIMQAPSPHTDDSTLVFIPGEKCLFFGDSVLGHFPDGFVDEEQMDALITMVEELDFDYALTGHWELRTKEQVLADMQEHIFD